jgi:hypothetical protein
MVPQLPQLFPSVCVFEQVPAQFVGVALEHTQLPLEHTRLLPQETEHIPQLLLSVLRLAQALPHDVYPDAQLLEVLTHLPAPLHFSPLAQIVPQPPQLVLLSVKLTQLPWPMKENPPHCVRPDGQAHVPLLHATPPAQTVPHEPQLRLSVDVSTHEVLLPPKPMNVHAVSPLLHTMPASPDAHLPLEHTALPLHRVPQEPQLLLSVCALTHALPHCVSPAPHAHVPPLHAALVGHWCPQLPQLSASVCVSTHALLQLVRFVEQVTLHAPALQTGVPPSAWHGRPQPPQLFGSLWIAVHAPPLH